MRMCLSHLVVIFVFSISDESSTCHLPAQLPLPHCSQQVLFYTISDSFTSLRSNNILQWRCCWQNSESLYLFTLLWFFSRNIRRLNDTPELKRDASIVNVPGPEANYANSSSSARSEFHAWLDAPLWPWASAPERLNPWLESDVFVPTWNWCMKCRAGRSWRETETFVSGAADLNSWFSSLLPLMVFSLLWIIQTRWHPPSPS